jgi:hypothetical protein
MSKHAYESSLPRRFLRVSIGHFVFASFFPKSLGAAVQVFKSCCLSADCVTKRQEGLFVSLCYSNAMELLPETETNLESVK